jgi:large subunit ribosomal protein L15
MRPEMRDVIKKLPKLRGFGKNRARTVNNERELALVVNVAALESTFNAGDAINPKALVAAGLIDGGNKKKPKVKILGNGELTKKLVVTGCTVSASAKEKIEKAGGSIN